MCSHGFFQYRRCTWPCVRCTLSCAPLCACTLPIPLFLPACAHTWPPVSCCSRTEVAQAQWRSPTRGHVCWQLGIFGVGLSTLADAPAALVPVIPSPKASAFATPKAAATVTVQVGNSYTPVSFLAHHSSPIAVDVPAAGTPLSTHVGAAGTGSATSPGTTTSPGPAHKGLSVSVLQLPTEYDGSHPLASRCRPLW